jgi:hypothetical protein
MRFSNGPRGLFRKVAAGVALCLPFVLVFLAAVELWLRLTTNLPFASRTHCFSQTKVEAPGFLPNCEETLRNPKGSFHFRTNEDGFRDHPRAYFAKGAVALLGDSYVEGFWLDEENGLARRLEKNLGWKEPLLNLGIRASGPTQQAIRLFRAWREVPLRGVIWVINPSDPLDEILFRERNKGFEMTREKWSELKPLWQFTPAYQRLTRWSVALKDRLYLLLYVAEKWIKLGSQSKLLENAQFSREPHCRAVELVAAELKAAALPLIFVAIPHGMAESHRPYLGMTIEKEPFERLLECARATGAPLVDLRRELNGQPDWYWDNDWHFNDAGTERAAGIIAPRIRTLWRAKP